ncbi:MAG: ATP-binding protein [Gammaproteobacteria bacterium]
MGRLFFKLYSILVLAVVVYYLVVSNLDTILHGTLEKYYRDLSGGTYTLIEKQLIRLPEEQWPELLSLLNKGGGYQLQLLPVNSLIFSPADKERLMHGEMVVLNGSDTSQSYQRILQSDWLLQFPFEQSESEDNQRLSRSTFNLFEKLLQEKPRNHWQATLEEISQDFSFPVVLLNITEMHLTDPLQQRLVEGEIVWQFIDDDNDYLYHRVVDSTYVIRMGPFSEPLTLNYLQTILLLTLAVLVALATLFWIYPLWRDLKQMGMTAEAFGQGDFNVRVPLTKRSVLHRFGEIFNGMAGRIQGLISSHKELTNAVSHELRTPIARLRFGMEMLHTSTAKSDRQRYLESMSADIDELDTLVAELLTYARFDRDKPILEFQRQAVEPWMSDIIKQSIVGNNRLTVNYRIIGNNNHYAQFEPRLMARALANLLQNAQRYAHSRIEVVFSQEANRSCFIVDDDGSGIPENQRTQIFEAFKRLDASRDRETGGYGLGLSIVQRIMQWHGGEVIVTDSPLGGARFMLCWEEK